MMIAERLGLRIPKNTTGEQLSCRTADFYPQVAAHMALAVSRDKSLPFSLPKEIKKRGFHKGNSVFWTAGNVVTKEEFTAEYKPGAIAAIAVTGKKGFMSMPKKVEYVNVLAGPPQADERILSLGRIHQDRPQGLIGISINPFNRDGISKQRIDDCGIMSIIRAATKATNKKDGPYGNLIVVGQMEITKALIAAAAVKALGGTMEIKNPSLSLDKLFPKEDEQEPVVYVGLTTDDHYFGKPGVIKGGNGSYFVTTAIIANEEINFKSINIKIPGTVTRHF